MKPVKKKVSKKEPTITDVMGVVNTLAGSVDTLAVSVQDLTEAVQAGFAKVEKRLGGAEEKLDSVEATLGRHGKLLNNLVEGQDHLRQDIATLDQRVSKTQSRIEDVVDEMQPAIVNHERRLTRLEKAPA